MDSTATYTLGDLIDLAEANNPQTKAAWENAKARAAAIGVARSSLFPTLVALVLSETSQSPVLFNSSFVVQDLGLFQPALSLSYTILDFGARQDQLAAAHANLLAANFAFNDVHLHVIYQVTHTYYRLQNAKGLRDAAEVNVTDAKALQQASEERLANGLATLPDVLDARSATAQAEYDLQSAIDAQQVAFGDLSTALTASPTLPFKVQDLNDLSVPEKLGESADQAIDRALEQRPDLLTRVAQVRAANAEVKQARSAFFPTLAFNGREAWVRGWGHQLGYPSTYAGAKAYDAQLNLSWTVFDGWQRESNLAHAKAERAKAMAEVSDARDQIADQVWKGYSDAETAFRQRQAATAFLVASSESYAADLEAYKDGVRDILDVLAAERTLARARAADVTARTQVLDRVAELAFRTGDLLTTQSAGVGP